MDNNPEKELSPADKPERVRKGGTPGIPLTAAHRAKIANSNILNRMIEGALGNIEMSSVQKDLSIALLKKVLPDMTTNEITGNPDEPLVHEIRRTIVRPT